MGGYINTSKSGEYLAIECLNCVNSNLVSATKAMMHTLQSSKKAFYEGYLIDHKGAFHASSENTCHFPGVYVATIGGPAGAIMGGSDIFFINGYAVCHSGTKKYQNTGNSPISVMQAPTTAESTMYIES